MPKQVIKPKSLKISKKEQEKQNRQMRVTVYFGYGLFLLSILILLGSLSSWIRWLTMPQTNHINIVIIIVTFVITALASPLIGYFVGDSSTRSKVKLIHHFNGVLFGLTAVWLTQILSVITTYIQWFFPISNTIENALFLITPSVIAIIILAVFGVAYAHSTKHKVSLVDYRPFQILVLSTIVGLLGVLAIQALIGANFGSDIGMNFIIFVGLPVSLIVAVIVTGYVILGERNGTPIARIVKSAIAASFAFISYGLISQATTYFTSMHSELAYYMIIPVLIIWIGYLAALRKIAR